MVSFVFKETKKYIYILLPRRENLCQYILLRSLCRVPDESSWIMWITALCLQSTLLLGYGHTDEGGNGHSDDVTGELKPEAYYSSRDYTDPGFRAFRLKALGVGTGTRFLVENTHER